MNLKITQLFKDFTSSERNAGIVLLLCTGISLLLANSSFTEGYTHFWHQTAGFQFANISLNFSIQHWVNDGLMTIFFLLVGLEIERELYAGELHPIKNALLPIAAAIGGMIMPALIYSYLNSNTNTAKGFGIPMGTDIAFALGILALAGKRVPVSIKVLLTAVAIIDDLGSILIIALFYGTDIQITNLLCSLSIFGVLLLLNRIKFYYLPVYLILGVIMWFFMMRSGIHPAISGVLLAFAIPFGDGSSESISIKLQQRLHLPVAFIILPIFTLANTAIPIRVEYTGDLLSQHTIGIALGLIIGKPIGISTASYLMLKTKIVTLPQDTNWYTILCMGCIAGIGFTMSIFITQLAFTKEVTIQSSKLMILIASGISASIGLALFYLKSERKNFSKD